MMPINQIKSIFVPALFFILIGLSGCDRNWTGDIHGNVKDKETTTPIPGVVMSASSEKNSYSVTTVTDSDGNYRLQDTRWGPNRVTAYHPHYESAAQYADVVRDRSVTIDFELVADPDSIDSTVLVFTTNADLVPIENVRVDLYRIDKGDTDDYVYETTKYTDPSGHIRFDLSSIREDEIEFYQVRLAVVGYYNAEREFSSTWANPNPEVHVIMEAAP